MTRILAFDTSGAHCTAALWPGAGTSLFEEMKRGQAERLRPMCEEVLAASGNRFSDLDAIGVGIGPGNFTGIRIAVSFARGLAASLGIPAIGVSGFELLHHGRSWPGSVLISLPALQDRAYLQSFVNGQPQSEPEIGLPCRRDTAIEHPNMVVAGYRAREIAETYDVEYDEEVWTDRNPQVMATNIALIAANKLRAAGGIWSERPAPLYVRPADAAPASDPPPVILP